MKIKKQYIIFLLSFLFLLLGTTISYGAYSATDKTVNSGEKVSITVTSSEALDAYNLDLSSADGLTFNNCSKTESGAIVNINGSSIGYINMSGSTKTLGTYNFTAPTVTTDKTYTVKFLLDKKTTIIAKVTVKAPVTNEPDAETPNTPTNPTAPGNTGTTTTPTKSKEARLSNLGIKPNDFKGFKRDTYEYNVEVPNEVEKVNVYAQTVDSKAKITSGTGNVTLKEGKNTVKIVVTAEDGKTQKTYTLNITRKTADVTAEEPEKKSSEARLSNLGIKPKEYDFTGFKKELYTYNVEVPTEIEEIEVYADAVNSKAKIEGTGKVTLKEGENKIEVKVTAEDEKTTQTYTLIINRLQSAVTEVPEEGETIENKDILGLTSLVIKDLSLSPKFNSKTYEYTIGLTKDLTTLEIQAKANNSDATVEIIGNENLINGENIITILVSNSETEENATYQIIVNKNVIIDEVILVNWLEPSTWGTREKIIIGIAIALIITIIVSIIIKIRIAKKEEDEFDLPGADELDKALTEHQELTDDVGETKTDIEKAQEYFEEYSKRKGKHF